MTRRSNIIFAGVRKFITARHYAPSCLRAQFRALGLWNFKIGPLGSGKPNKLNAFHFILLPTFLFGRRRGSREAVKEELLFNTTS